MMIIDYMYLQFRTKRLYLNFTSWSKMWKTYVQPYAVWGFLSFLISDPLGLISDPRGLKSDPPFCGILIWKVCPKFRLTLLILNPKFFFSREATLESAMSVRPSVRPFVMPFQNQASKSSIKIKHQNQASKLSVKIKHQNQVSKSSIKIKHHQES